MGIFKSFKDGLIELAGEVGDDEFEDELDGLEEEKSEMEQEQPKYNSQGSKYASKRDETVVSKDTVIIGTMKGKGLVRLEGTIDGEVDFEGDLIVAKSGVVKGPVTVSTMRVAGAIEGNVNVKKHLCLERTGKIQGDVETVSLVIEDGGRLNGRTTMTVVDDGGSADDVRLSEQKLFSKELQFGPNYPSSSWKQKQDEEDTVDPSELFDDNEADAEEANVE